MASDTFVSWTGTDNQLENISILSNLQTQDIRRLMSQVLGPSLDSTGPQTIHVPRRQLESTLACGPVRRLPVCRSLVHLGCWSFHLPLLPSSSLSSSHLGNWMLTQASTQAPTQTPDQNLEQIATKAPRQNLKPTLRKEFNYKSERANLTFCCILFVGWLGYVVTNI